MICIINIWLVELFKLFLMFFIRVVFVVLKIEIDVILVENSIRVMIYEIFGNLLLCLLFIR